jgi:hypothetical protein
VSYSTPRHNLSRAKTCVLIALLLALPRLSAAQTGTVETLGGLNDPAVPDRLRSVLVAKGYRILLDANSPAVEVWYRKEIPVQPKTASADAVYDRMAESTLVGVLHFGQASEDYRGQSVPAGFYTLRYALMPNDGNHLGVAPSRDFLLLIPANADPGPEKILKFQDLMVLSRQASGTKHPAPLSLVQAEAGAGSGLSKDDEGHVIFTTAIHLSSGGDMPLALVVKGTAPQ